MSVPVIRLFVSSTFDDFWVEREALRTMVFPVLEALCREEGIQFRAIDLRWGVSPFESARHDTIDICLGELRRCQRMSPKPNFMVMLGDRFGWQPPLPAMPEERFRELLAAIPNADERAFVAHCYPAELKDENAIPPTRRLRPLAGAAGFDDERRIRGILGRHYRHTDGSVLERDWFKLSATGLEILVGVLDQDLPGETVDNVWCLERRIHDMPANGQAARYRDVHAGAPDLDSETLLGDLKRRLRDAVPPHNYFQYEEAWVGAPGWTARDLLPPEEATRADLLGILGKERCAAYDQRWSDPGALAFMGLNPDITHHRIRAACDRTLAALARIVRRRIAEVKATPLHLREDQAHREYQAAVAEGVVCAHAGQDFLADHLAGSDDAPYLLVTGPGGGGKTAALAKAMARHGAAAPGRRIVARYLGVTSSSVNVRALLHEIMQNLGVEHPSVHTPQVVRRQLRDALEREPAVILIDGVDRLSGRDLRWLLAAVPTRLGKGSGLILSAGPDRADEIADADPALPWRQWTLPPLGDADAAQAIACSFGRHALSGRTLQPAQLDCILDGFRGAGRLPLYLPVAAALARGWTSGHVAVLPTSLEALVADHIAALGKHGPVLVAAALALFAVSRAGLSEGEIVDLLSGDAAVMAECRRNYPKEAGRLTRLPDMIWSRLYADLEGFFAEAEAGGVRVLRFAHGRFTDAVLAHVMRYDDPPARRRQIAGYFHAQLDSAEDGAGWRRLYFELPHQLYESGEYDRLAALLSSRHALAHMCDPHRLEPGVGYVADSMFAELCLYWARLRERGYPPARYLSDAVATDDDAALPAPFGLRIDRVLNAIGEAPLGSGAIES